VNVLSLFSGIGGFDLGLQRAGFEISTQVEIDPFCTKILEKHWPEVERYGDIREFDDFPKADLICAGFPCQDISVAGKGAGLSGATFRTLG
jgi:DNA (cytosine-5)-methyltransferase 1